MKGRGMWAVSGSLALQDGFAGYVALLGKCHSAMVKHWCVLLVHWPGVNAQVSRCSLGCDCNVL